MEKVKLQKYYISPEILKEDKTVLEDLIKAAHNNAKLQLKDKTSEEISKATGGLEYQGLSGLYKLNGKYF